MRSDEADSFCLLGIPANRIPMHTIIQLIETQWTKRSRGQPGAAVRNSVPEVVPFPANTPVETVLFQRLVYSEPGFVQPVLASIAPLSPEDADKWRISVLQTDLSAEISFFGIPFTETSGRPTKVIRLDCNSWFQIVGNRRVDEGWTWGYRKFVYNVFHGEASLANEIVATVNPVCRLQYEEHLW